MMPDMDEQPRKRGGPFYWLKRRSRWFWIATLALLPVLYVASFGPMCWYCSRQSGSNPHTIPYLYVPLGQCALHSDWVYEASCRFATIGMPKEVQVGVPYWSDGIYLLVIPHLGGHLFPSSSE
jgi:hypothetical protein